MLKSGFGKKKIILLIVLLAFLTLFINGLGNCQFTIQLPKPGECSEYNASTCCLFYEGTTIIGCSSGIPVEWCGEGHTYYAEQSCLDVKEKGKYLCSDKPQVCVYNNTLYAHGKYECSGDGLWTCEAAPTSTKLCYEQNCADTGKECIVDQCCTVLCSSDANCLAGETCVNPRTCDALCCNLTCSSDIDCGVDEVCVKPGTCDSFCSYIFQGKIGFFSTRDGTYEIYVMNGDGSSQTKLTNSLATKVNPTLSADGKKIAFTSNDLPTFSVYVINSDGSNLTKLTDNSAMDSHPSWSPNGTKIVFAKDMNMNPDIWVMNADGSNQVRLTNYSAPIATNWDGDPAWSPDGTEIAFSSHRDGYFNKEIYVMNADGSNQRRLTHDDSLSINSDWGPAWSPDGTKIAYASNRDKQVDNEIWVMNANGSDAIILTNNEVNDYEPVWSLDGKKIAYVSAVDGNKEIYVMNTDGSNKARLTYNGEEEGSPSWSKVVCFSNADCPTGETCVNPGICEAACV